MQIDDPRAGRRRRLKVFAVVAFFAAALLVPAALYLLRGRKLPLRVAAQASAYVVEAGAVVELTAHVEGRGGRGVAPVLGWSGPGVQGGPSPARARFVAPAAPGSYTVTLRARLSGNVIKERMSIQVVDGKLAEYRPVRPRRAPAMPSEKQLPAWCKGATPTVEVIGRPCRGANLVARLRPGDGGDTVGLDNVGHHWDVWHHWVAPRGAADGDSACWGRVVNLRVPLTAKPGPLSLRSLALFAPTKSKAPLGAPCVAVVSTVVRVEDCGGPSTKTPVFADFIAQLAGPGAFRFAAEPARARGVRFETYAWDFGDGKRKRGSQPTTTHTYDEPRRFRLVRLRVTAGERSAESVRVIYDRTASDQRLGAQGPSGPLKRNAQGDKGHGGGGS